MDALDILLSADETPVSENEVIADILSSVLDQYLQAYELIGADISRKPTLSAHTCLLWVPDNTRLNWTAWQKALSLFGRSGGLGFDQVAKYIIRWGSSPSPYVGQDILTGAKRIEKIITGKDRSKHQLMRSFPHDDGAVYAWSHTHRKGQVSHHAQAMLASHYGEFWSTLGIDQHLWHQHV